MKTAIITLLAITIGAGCAQEHVDPALSPARQVPGGSPSAIQTGEPDSRLPTFKVRLAGKWIAADKETGHEGFRGHLAEEPAVKFYVDLEPLGPSGLPCIPAVYGVGEMAWDCAPFVLDGVAAREQIIYVGGDQLVIDAIENNRLYTIAYIAPAELFKKYRGDFDELVKSFRFVKGAPT